MDVNDNAGCLIECVVLKFFASKLAPTGRGVSGGFAVEIQHTHARQQIRLRQVRMLVPAQRAIHQPMAILNVEGKAADQCLLFVALRDEVEAILVFSVEHDGVRVGFDGARDCRIQMTKP